MKLDKKFIYYFLALDLHWAIFVEMAKGLSIIFFGYEFSGITIINKLVLMMLLGIFTLLILKRKRGVPVIVVSLGWCCLCILTLVLTPKVSIILPKSMFYSITQVIIFIFLFSEVDDPSRLEKHCIPYIYIGVIYSIIQWLVFNFTGQYSMQYSYGIIIPALLSLLISIDKKRFHFITFFGFFFLVNLRCGSRGSLVCYGIALIFIFVIFSKTKGRILFLLSIIPLGGILFLNMQNIFTWLSQYFTESRTIQLFAEGKFLYLSSRDKYYSYILETFLKEPLSVKGIYSDRIYLGDFFGRTDVASIFGSYSHNFFLEILFQFGIWGIPILLMCILVLFHSIKKIKRCENASMKRMYIVFCSYCIGQLLFSSSYLTATSFGAFVGMSSTVYLYKRNSYE